MLSQKIKRPHLFLLALLSGILLAISWPENGFPGLLFIALIPLLFVEEYISSHREQFIRFSLLFYSYPAFFLFNLLTTWWIYNSTFMGAVMAIVINSVFLTVVFQCYSWTKKQVKNRYIGYVALISYWVAFEYLHLNWILTWPWLNLGNGFASFHTWVQWYEYTGALGGTLWIWGANIMLWEAIRMFFRKPSGSLSKSRIPATGSRLIPWYWLIGWVVWITIPLIISLNRYHNYTEPDNPVSFVVVQPNIDPYSEQYVLPPKQVIGRIMELAEPLLDSNTQFLIAPESAIQESIWEREIAHFMSIRLLDSIIKEYPALNIIIGASTFREFLPGEPLSRTARKFSQSDGYYDAFNTAILLNASDSLQLYHKSKLTPGVEALPSFKGFKWLEEFALDLGGTVGSLGTDDIRKVYICENAPPASPAICYESVFGEFFATFVRNGAEIMIIITNDGWWGNTPGHRQHFSFSRLRAIETRRSIARSANTGISAFINQRGDASHVTEYWVPGAFKGNINANDMMTFYVCHGDYLARIAVWFTVVLFGLSIVIALYGKLRRKLKA